MNYIERVLPSLGEDAVTLRSIGAVASDVVAAHAASGSDPPPVGRDQGQPADGRGARAGWSHEPPAGRCRWSCGSPSRATSWCCAAAVLAQIRADVLAHHKLNLGRDGRRAGPARRAVAGQRRRRPRPGAGRVRRPGHRHRRLRRVRAAPGGRRSARPTPWPGWPTRTCCARLSGRHAVQRRVRPAQRQLSRPAASGRDWTVADGGLLDELVHLLGPLPEPEEPEVSLFLDPDSEVAEVVTTADRLAPVREVDPFATPARHVRAHPGRRGAGHHADAVADAPPPRPERQLDHRRRPGAELLAGSRGGRPGAGRDGRHRTGPPVPDEHQLPQPGRGVRPGRPGGACRPTRRPTCPRAVRSTGRRAASCRIAGPTGWRPAVDAACRDLLDAGRGHGRRDRPAVPARRDAGRALDAAGRSRDDRVVVVDRRCRPRAWSTTAVLVVDPGRDRGQSPGRRARALRRPDPADPAAGHARRRSWLQVGEDLSGRAGTVQGEEVQPGRAAGQQLLRQLGGDLDADLADLLVVVGRPRSAGRSPRPVGPRRTARRTAGSGARW